MEPSEIASLLEQTARAIYVERGPRAVHPGQWAVLRFLALADQNDRTIGGVAAYLDVTHAPASRAVASLVRKGLATSMISSGDGRVRHVSLTNKGAALLKSDPVIRLATEIKALSPKSQKVFRDTLVVIHARLAGA